VIGPGPRNQVRPAGFEPATRCLEGTVEPSLDIAWYRSMGRLTALMSADRGPASLGSCGRWLPIWLPALADSVGVRTQENGYGGGACGQRLT
jgi:hypothetical protein